MPLTQEARAQRRRDMVHRYKGGDTVAEVAAYFGVSDETVRYALRRSGVNSRVPVITPATRVRNLAIVAAFARGDTMQAIGENFEMTRERVRQILNAAGVDTRRRRQVRSRIYAEQRAARDAERTEEVLAAYRQTPSTTAVAKSLGVGRDAVERIVRAGIPLPERKKLHRQQIAVSLSGQRPRASDEELMQALRDHAATLDGAKVTLVTWNPWASENGWPSHQIFIQRFGSWVEALERAGVPHGQSVGPKPLFTEDDMLAALRRITRSIGHQPSMNEYRALRRATEPGEVTIRTRLGSGRWLEALERAA